MIIQNNKQAPFVIHTKEEEIIEAPKKSILPNPYMVGIFKKDDKAHNLEDLGMD
jgi:hypothetical protein